VLDSREQIKVHLDLANLQLAWVIKSKKEEQNEDNIISNPQLFPNACFWQCKQFEFLAT